MPVDYTVDTTSVRAYGPGLDPKNVREGIPQTFKIDASKAGQAPLSVDIVGGNKIDQIKFHFRSYNLIISCAEL